MDVVTTPVDEVARTAAATKILGKRVAYWQERLTEWRATVDEATFTSILEWKGPEIIKAERKTQLVAGAEAYLQRGDVALTAKITALEWEVQKLTTDLLKGRRDGGVNSTCPITRLIASYYLECDAEVREVYQEVLAALKDL